jgi:hypothetical protein
MKNIADQFHEHGWIILKNFFSPDEIKNIRTGVENSVTQKITGDLLCNPYLQDLTVLHPKIIKLIGELLGGEPVYIGDSSVSFNDLAMSLHKDNPDRFHAEAPDWQSTYSVLRMGIYLQDYESHSGGLILRDKSHNYVSRWKGKIINVKTNPGDLVLWNLRTTHSGNARRFKLFPNWDINPYINKYLPEFLFKPKHTERAALFLSYGKDDGHLKRYIDYLKTRTYAVERWRSMVITDDIKNKAAQRGLKLKDFSEEAKKIKDSEVHADHQEIKF